MDQIQAFELGLLPFRNVVHARADQHLIDRMHYYGVPGVSIAVINDGMLAWAQGYGMRDEATATPITPDTRFPVASAIHASRIDHSRGTSQSKIFVPVGTSVRCSGM